MFWFDVRALASRTFRLLFGFRLIARSGLRKSSQCSKKFERLLLRLWDMTGQPSFSDNFSDIELFQLAQVQLLAVADGVKLPKSPENLSVKMNGAGERLQRKYSFQITKGNPKGPS